MAALRRVRQTPPGGITEAVQQANDSSKERWRPSRTQLLARLSQDPPRVQQHIADTARLAIALSFRERLLERARARSVPLDLDNADFQAVHNEVGTAAAGWPSESAKLIPWRCARGPEVVLPAGARAGRRHRCDAQDGAAGDGRAARAPTGDAPARGPPPGTPCPGSAAGLGTWADSSSAAARRRL